MLALLHPLQQSFHGDESCCQEPNIPGLWALQWDEWLTGCNYTCKQQVKAQKLSMGVKIYARMGQFGQELKATIVSLWLFIWQWNHTPAKLHDCCSHVEVPKGQLCDTILPSDCLRCFLARMLLCVMLPPLHLNCNTFYHSQLKRQQTKRSHLTFNKHLSLRPTINKKKNAKQCSTHFSKYFTWVAKKD